MEGDRKRERVSDKIRLETVAMVTSDLVKTKEIEKEQMTVTSRKRKRQKIGQLHEKHSTIGGI